MEKANLRIMELFNHYTPERRNNTIVNFDKKIVKNGDFLLFSRFDGIDPLIMLGSGGDRPFGGLLLDKRGIICCRKSRWVVLAKIGYSEK